ncbi:MAG TPA: transcription antitermination factor NusB [Firmicutes bacterium]|nr:transcription antitermination factor NusB [Bacillota bacterium]
MLRHRAREVALRTLFQLDLSNGDLQEAFAAAQEGIPLNEGGVEFARRLVEGTLENLPGFDKKITGLVRAWRLERLARVDHNILRMAFFEIYHCPDIPIAVTINEAVELAKEYNSETAARFINGILGSVARELTGTAEERKPAAESELQEDPKDAPYTRE